MKTLINIFLLIIPFLLDFGESSWLGESSRERRGNSPGSMSPPQRHGVSLGQPSRNNQPVKEIRPQGLFARGQLSRSHLNHEADRCLGLPGIQMDHYVLDLNAEASEELDSQTRTLFFRMRDNLPPPVEGPANSYLMYHGERIEVLLDGDRTMALRASYPGNYIPSFSYSAKNNFICRLAVIGGIKLVEYIHQNGKLIGVRAPIPSPDNVIMEPNKKKWFIVYDRQYFEVTQNIGEPQAKAISLVPDNFNVEGDIGRPAVFKEFRFKVIRRPDGKISGAALF